MLALGLGGLALLAGSSAKAMALPGPVPTTPPTPAPPSVPVSTKPKSKPKVSAPVATSSDVPATVNETVLPSGWIAAPPSSALSQAAKDMANLGDPVGTRYPFQIENRKYLAVVIADGAAPSGKTVAVLQPDNQI